MRSLRLPVVTAIAATLVASLAAAPFAAGALPLPHLKLRRSAPAADTTLAEAPRQITLWFSEAPELPFTKVSLAGADAREVAVGKPARGADAADPSVVVPVVGRMGPGRYTVTWRTASKDGHPVSGTLAFTVSR